MTAPVNQVAPVVTSHKRSSLPHSPPIPRLASGVWRLAFPRPLSLLLPSPLPLSFQLSSLLPSSPSPSSLGRWKFDVGRWTFALLFLFLLFFLSLPSLAEDKYIRRGQSIVDVAVTLTGPEERLLVLTGDTNPPCCTYTANGSYNVIGEFEEEDPEIPVVETYTWDVDEEVVEIVSGGGATDNSITIRFRPDKEADTSVSVTYTVFPPGGSDSDTVEVVVPNWTPGDPIQCGEISTPANGAVLPAGAEVVLAIPQPTDNDTRSGLATTTEADTCIVTWTATAGTFKDGIDTGTSVVWIAPEEGGAGISISATVTDEAVVPPREKGNRSDAGGAAMACSAAAAAPALASFAMAAAGEGGIVRTIQANVARVVSVTCNGTVSTATAPAVLAVPLGYSDGGGLAGTLTLSPLSNLEGLLPAGVPPWPAGQPEWTGIIANEDGTATLDTTVPGTHQLAVACGTSAVPITVHIVEVAQLECKGVVSVTEAAPDPIVAPDVPVGNPASVTITATLNPAGAPLPVQYLVWTGNHVAGNGLTAILETGTTGTHVAKLTCGTSIKRFSVNVVGISSLHCCGETATPDEPGSLVLPLEHGAPSVQITAIHTPAAADFPEAAPVWTGDATGEGISAQLSTMASGTYNVTATCGTSSATFHIRIVQVASLTCGALVSTTSTPGPAETTNIPVGHIPDPEGENLPRLRFTAQSAPGDWPPGGYPDWGGATSSSGDTATLSTQTPGSFLVHANCGNRRAIRVNVIDIQSAKVRRQGSGDDYAATATIAAGGLDNAVHKADIEFTIDPVPEGPFSVTLPVVVANADGYPDDNLPATLCLDGTPILVGSGTADITFSSTDPTPGKRYGTLVSGNRMTATGSPCTVGDAAVAFAWDCSGAYDFQHADYFVPGCTDDIHAFLTLDEVANLDEDGDSNVGEGAIGGHELLWLVSSVTVEFWQYDHSTGTYLIEPEVDRVYSSEIDLGQVDFEVGPSALGVSINDLIVLGTPSESPNGQYTSPQTVNDYIDDAGGIETVILVLDYTFSYKDLSVFKAPSAP